MDRVGGVEATTSAAWQLDGTLHLRLNNDICYLFFMDDSHTVIVGKLGSRWRLAYSFAKVSLHMWSV